MKPQTVLKRRQQRFAKAVKEVTENQSTYRDASSRYLIPRSTLNGAVLNLSKPTLKKSGRRPSLLETEEKMLVQLLCRYSDRGVSLSRAHLYEATAIIVTKMSSERRKNLQFKNGMPGKKWLQCITERHSRSLSFMKPTCQEALRFAACNGDTMATHFATLEKVLKEHNIDDKRVWNLDECEATPGKDLNARLGSKRFLRKDSGKDIKVASFLNLQRVTMMPAISASGNTALPLFF